MLARNVCQFCFLCAFIMCSAAFYRKPIHLWLHVATSSAVTRGLRAEVPGSLMWPLHWTSHRSLRMRNIFFLFFLFFPPGSHKHQRQTWVGSKCSLEKPTTLRNGRPNSSPWWRAITKFGTRACIHFPGMGCPRQLPLSNDSVWNCFLS